MLAVVVPVVRGVTVVCRAVTVAVGEEALGALGEKPGVADMRVMGQAAAVEAPGAQGP